ncbi:permease-like cell division protein FtsX [Actinoplanes sp. NPDC049599]|uniref:permease-like cell division protein FtsX n=1 Tax=Actinoplanes sp. NPDC049599 TaxID=3363903 RepID=UPI00378E9E06
MRLLKIITAASLAIAALTACSIFEESDEERGQRLLDDNAAIVVFLTDDATQQQKGDIEARLRALPDVTDVVFEDEQSTYDNMKDGLSDDQLLDNFTSENFPEDFRVKMADQAAVRRFRDSRANSELGALAGVEKVVIPCTTVAECRESARKLPTKSPD